MRRQTWATRTFPRRDGAVLSLALLVALAITVLLSGCSTIVGDGGVGGGSTITGSGTPATDTRAVSGFHEVDFSGVGELDIQQTGTESLRIQADANLLPLLTSNVSNGRLTLGSQPDATFQTTSPIRYTLTVKTLDTVVVSGAGTTQGSDLDSANLRVTMSGVGSVTLQGHADALTLDVSGTGSFDGSALASRTATVTVGGTGNAVVQVSDTLDATVSGVGSIEYIGNPKVTSHVSGVGTIHKRG